MIRVTWNEITNNRDHVVNSANSKPTITTEHMGEVMAFVWHPDLLVPAKQGETHAVILDRKRNRLLSKPLADLVVVATLPSA